MLRISGIINRIIADRGFAFAVTDEGDVFIHFRIAGPKKDRLVVGATVDLEYMSKYNLNAKTEKDRYQMSATKLLSVNEPVVWEVLTKVTSVNAKEGHARVGSEGMSQKTAFLSAALCSDMGIVPDVGMPLRAAIIESGTGPVVIGFEWGRAVHQAYIEAEAALQNVEPEPEVDSTLGATEALIEAMEKVEAAPKPKVAKKAPGKVRRVKGGIPTAASYGINTVDLPDGPMAAQLAELGLKGDAPNGATAH